MIVLDEFSSGGYKITEDRTCTLRATGPIPIVHTWGGCGMSTGRNGVMVESKPMVYDARGNGDGNTVPNLTGDHENGITDYTAVVVTADCRNGAVNIEKSGTLQAKPNDGFSYNCINPVVYGICSNDSNSMKSPNPHSGIYKADTTRTLDANGGNPSCNQGGMVVLEGNGSRPSHKGDGYSESETMYTLNTTEQHAVCISNGQADQLKESDKVGALNCMHDQQAIIENTYSVRRLTPTECQRLQGFPDSWGTPDHKDDMTDEEAEFWNGVRKTFAEANGKKFVPKSKEALIDWYNKLHTDSAEYKMWGNGIALPCAEFVLAGIEKSVVNTEDNERNET